MDEVPFAECSALAVAAQPTTMPVDIVWVIDASGSMGREAAIVQNTLTQFVAGVEAAGIDMRVVVITEAGFVSVPPPLGTDSSRFRFISTEIDSDNSLPQTLATFPLWRDFLRPNGQLHLVEVSDSDGEDMTPGAFMTQFAALLGGKTYRYHSIVSPPGSTNNYLLPGDGCELPGVRQATNNGDEYWAISQATGGTTHSICTDDWTPIFDQLFVATTAPAAIPCRYDIPAAPMGETFDRNLVNVRYTPAGRAGETIGHVPSGAGGCAGAGWFYEGTATAPTGIGLCPATCTTVGAGGAVDIAFGCEIELI